MVRPSLEEISKELDEVEKRRERLLRESRDVISLSAKAIISIHASDLKKAQSNLRDAKKILNMIRPMGTQDLHKYLIQPQAEYAEAQILYSIASKKPLPSHRALTVDNASYLLGLLDAIGEIKRRVYDQIRKGKGGEASRLFEQMEQLYVLLLPFAVYEHVAQGVKRKLDVARILIENTRSVITEEVRRMKFIESMKRVSTRMQKERKG